MTLRRHDCNTPSVDHVGILSMVCGAFLDSGLLENLGKEPERKTGLLSETPNLFYGLPYVQRSLSLV